MPIFAHHMGEDRHFYRVGGMKNIVCFLVLTVSMLSCTKKTEPVGRVAILFPVQTDDVRWKKEAESLQSYFLLANFTVSMGFAATADGDDGQASQIDKVRSFGCNYLILASMDVRSEAVNDALSAFCAAGGRVVCYDRLQRDTPDVGYYVGAAPADAKALKDDPKVETVSDQYVKATFNLVYNVWVGGRSLPSDTPMIFNGAIEVPCSIIGSGKENF